MTYDAVLFDNDGVLVEPPDEAVLREATLTAFAELGMVDPDADHVETMAVSTTPAGLRRVCDECGFDADELQRVRDRTASDAQRREIRAGRRTTYEDVSALDELDCPLGVVSSNQHATVEFVLEHFELGHHFGTYYGRPPTIEGVRRKKPEPYYLRKALSDLDAESALFVGDSESDVLAAENAGLDSAFVRRRHRADYPLSVSPTHEIGDLTGLPSLLRR